MQNQNESQLNKAYGYAIYLLGLRLRTEGELREKLRIKKYGSGIADQVVEQLKGNHYIDDRQYAEVYLENLKKYKTFGYFGIKKKLMERRLPANIIESVLSENLDEEEETRVAKRFIKNYELGIMNYEQKQKVAQKLKSRGFRGSVVAKLVF